MKDHGLTRFVTLWHWTLPQWLAEKGGFETKQGVEAFARYAWFVAQNLGTEVDFWITLNEPENYAASSYIEGNHPPFKSSLLLSRRVLNNLIQAHKAAYAAIKEALGDVPISIAKNNHYYQPYRKYNIFDRIVSYLAKKIGNDYFLEKISKHMDFIGLNYYFFLSLKADWRHGYVEMNSNQTTSLLELRGEMNRSDMGWLLYPQGIYNVIMELKRYIEKIYITENGLADGVDNRRPKFLRESLLAMKKAVDHGADVRGYLYWALTDNYEWHWGFGPRFGLIEIDYVTQKRTIRPSAAIFKEIQK